MIERKQLLAESYRRHYPLWLILGLTDERGIFTESLHELARLAGCGKKRELRVDFLWLFGYHEDWSPRYFV
jgi:hypothetical protein